MDLLSKQISSKPLKGHLSEIIEASIRIHKDRVLIDFTDHGFEHSERVVEFISQLCKNSPLFVDRRHKLNEYESFILLASVYLHDIGIQISDPNVLRSFSAEHGLEYDEANKQNFVRTNHHLLSGYWIRRNIMQDNALPKAYFGESELGELVQLVVESHGIDFFNSKRYSGLYSYKGENIRLKLLCILLSLGDAFDCDIRRIDYEKLKYSSIDPISKLHRMKHYYINSVLIENSVVHIYYYFPQTLSPHERNIYGVFFSQLNTFWMRKNQERYKSLLDKYHISFRIEEIYNYSLVKDCLNREEYVYIEEQVAEIVDKNRDGSYPIEASAMSIAIGILRRNDSVLLVKRRKKEGVLQWQFPAGIIKPSENPEDRVKEEFYNETGITVEVEKPIGKRIHPDTRMICYYFAMRYISGEAVNRDEAENSEAKWILLSKYQEYITSDLYYNIVKYLAPS